MAFVLEDIGLAHIHQMHILDGRVECAGGTGRRAFQAELAGRSIRIHSGRIAQRAEAVRQFQRAVGGKPPRTARADQPQA